MVGSKRYATVTDYDALYGTGYFAHGEESASFAKDIVPQIVANFCKNLCVNSVVDVGAGNGILGVMLRDYNVRCIDVDVTHRNDADFICFDISTNDQKALDEIAQNCAEKLSGGYLVTSFDMAEHIDLENIPDFVYNLGKIIQSDAIVSISTRPSSRANKYHCSILPIDTWAYLFSLVGLQASRFEILQEHRSDQQFRSSSQELLAVSVWQKRNLFHDEASHQHYLRLTRSEGILPSRQDVRDRIDAVLDISARKAKRELLGERKLPCLTYLVSFVQDWSFLRFFLEVWPADQVKVIIRRDFIAEAYADVIEAYLTRVGVVFRRVETINQASDALDEWEGGAGDLFITATEGLPTVLHGIASLVTIDARKRGMTTATLQHGNIVPARTVHAAQFFIAMNDKSVFDFEQSTVSPGTCTPRALGAPKHLDSTIALADPDAIAFRLRSSARHYRKRVLVGTNLHWLAHRKRDYSVASWLELAADLNPDVLFILRPHPDDWNILDGEIFKYYHNIMLLDEITLLCIDWPISRVLSSVDYVVSTHSTLIPDALAAGKPIAIFPTGISDVRLLNFERDWLLNGAVRFSERECKSGLLPSSLPDTVVVPLASSRQNYADFIFGLLDLLNRNDDPKALERAACEVELSFMRCCRDLNLDSHPHANREAVASAIGHFACR